MVVSIDIAKKVQWARIISPMGVDVIKSIKFHNNREGFKKVLGMASTWALRNASFPHSCYL